ncbi:MAG: CBS domain-containing protein [Saprospiraceae bacterium]
MLTVNQLLSHKKVNKVYAVRPDQMVIEALEVMETYNTGAVLVMEGEALVGVFSERDYARKGIIKGRKAKSTPISEVMSGNPFFVSRQHTIEDCLKLMSEKRFRHLPVKEGDQVIGVLSIGDIVSAFINEQAFRIESLEHYITRA